MVHGPPQKLGPRDIRPNPYNTVPVRSRPLYYRRGPRDDYSLFSGVSDGQRQAKRVGWDFSDLNSTGSTMYGHSSGARPRAYTSGTSANAWPRSTYSYTPVEPLYGRNTYERSYREKSDSEDGAYFSRRVRWPHRHGVPEGRGHSDTSVRNNYKWDTMNRDQVHTRYPHKDVRTGSGRNAPGTSAPRLEYVPRKKKAPDQDSVDKVVGYCLCGCVDIVKTTCCWGTKVSTCRCHDSDDEESDEETDSDFVAPEKLVPLERNSKRPVAYSDSDESDSSDDSETEEDEKWAKPRLRPPALVPARPPKQAPLKAISKQVQSAPPDPKSYEEYSTDDSSDTSSDSSDILTSVQSTSSKIDTNNNTDTLVATPKPRKTFKREKVELNIEPGPVDSTSVVFLPKQSHPPKAKPEKKKILSKYLGDTPKLDSYKTAIIPDMDSEEGPFVDSARDDPRHIQDTVYSNRKIVIYEPEPEILPPYKPPPVYPPPMFPLKKLPKREAVMVRVGGGWMNVEHHRKRRIALEIQEHHRAVSNDKYLVIKSKFTPNIDKIPVAYTKYRDKALWAKSKKT